MDIINILYASLALSNYTRRDSGVLIVHMFECFCGCNIFCVIQFHSAMEEFNKALQEKKYVDAANELERVRVLHFTSTQPYLNSVLGLIYILLYVQNKSCNCLSAAIST